MQWRTDGTRSVVHPVVMHDGCTTKFSSETGMQNIIPTSLVESMCAQRPMRPLERDSLHVPSSPTPSSARSKHNRVL